MYNLLSLLGFFLEILTFPFLYVIRIFNTIGLIEALRTLDILVIMKIDIRDRSCTVHYISMVSGYSFQESAVPLTNRNITLCEQGNYA